MGRASSVRMLTSTAVLVVAKDGTDTTSTCPERPRPSASLPAPDPSARSGPPGLAFDKRVGAAGRLPPRPSARSQPSVRHVCGVWSCVGRKRTRRVGGGRARRHLLLVVACHGRCAVLGLVARKEDVRALLHDKGVFVLEREARQRVCTPHARAPPMCRTAVSLRGPHRLPQ